MAAIKKSFNLINKLYLFIIFNANSFQNLYNIINLKLIT